MVTIRLHHPHAAARLFERLRQQRSDRPPPDRQHRIENRHAHRQQRHAERRHKLFARAGHKRQRRMHSPRKLPESPGNTEAGGSVYAQNPKHHGQHQIGRVAAEFPLNKGPASPPSIQPARPQPSIPSIQIECVHRPTSKHREKAVQPGETPPQSPPNGSRPNRISPPPPVRQLTTGRNPFLSSNQTINTIVQTQQEPSLPITENCWLIGAPSDSTQRTERSKKFEPASARNRHLVDAARVG